MEDNFFYSYIYYYIHMLLYIVLFGLFRILLWPPFIDRSAHFVLIYAQSSVCLFPYLSCAFCFFSKSCLLKASYWGTSVFARLSYLHSVSVSYLLLPFMRKSVCLLDSLYVILDFVYFLNRTWIAVEVLELGQ